MKVLITGCGGYIGSYLSRYLLSKGYELKCVDALFFGSDVVVDLIDNPKVEFHKLDARRIPPSLIEDVDAIVDMVAIANDPSAELDPNLTWDINFRSRVRLAKMSKELGIRKYILTSSCSVYGYQESMAYEETTPNPLTTYAKANLETEREVLQLADQRFNVIVLRLATAFGVSRRMRFDLVLNAMVLSAFKEGIVYVDGTGEQKRPLVHIADISRAIELVLRDNRLKKEVLNVGSNEQNISINELAKKVAKFTNAKIVYRKSLVDARSYTVNFDKIKRLLGFTTLYDIDYGIKEVYNALVLGLIKPEDRWWTVKTYRRLLNQHPWVRVRSSNSE